MVLLIRSLMSPLKSDTFVGFRVDVEEHRVQLQASRAVTSMVSGNSSENRAGARVALDGSRNGERCWMIFFS